MARLRGNIALQPQRRPGDARDSVPRFELFCRIYRISCGNNVGTNSIRFQQTQVKSTDCESTTHREPCRMPATPLGRRGRRTKPILIRPSGYCAVRALCDEIALECWQIAVTIRSRLVGYSKGELLWSAPSATSRGRVADHRRGTYGPPADVGCGIDRCLDGVARHSAGRRGAYSTAPGSIRVVTGSAYRSRLPRSAHKPARGAYCRDIGNQSVPNHRIHNAGEFLRNLEA